MSEISLEKVDLIKERTGVSYKAAKEALEKCNGDVLESLVYLESKEEVKDSCNKEEFESNKNESESESFEDFKKWLKELINKGNVSRIKIKKDDKVLVDVPVNAGIAATVIGVIVPPLLVFGVFAAVVTKITIEITKCDGSVEVVNKYIKKATDEVKDVAENVTDQIKSKFKKNSNNEKVYTGNETVYTYKVNFDEEDNKNNE
ncbi:MAG: DUF4342 domain-containing protein [Clostridiales bacterium]|nr:DUF4342 domain-containing protein [Clostridiales bacterium]